MSLSAVHRGEIYFADLDPVVGSETGNTSKYLLTNELTWEANKIISVYSNRWVIEEFENHKQSTAEKLPKESLTIPSIVRRAQYWNLEAFIERVLKDAILLKKWFGMERNNLDRKRKTSNILIDLEDCTETCT